jgi:hypothetical protein
MRANTGGGEGGRGKEGREAGREGRKRGRERGREGRKRRRKERKKERETNHAVLDHHGNGKLDRFVDLFFDFGGNRNQHRDNNILLLH